MHDPAHFNPVPGAVDQVADQVRRILAPNPSPMTFRGTNTYVVGQGTVAVIDPGPDDPSHLAAILAAVAGETISHILVTHGHLDHSPLALALSAHTGAPVCGFGTATAGRSAVMTALAESGLAGGGEGVDHSFNPDVILSDGAVVEGEGWQIQAHHTPGHMANHMSFAMGPTVFSGDHVMGWSTSLVSPPDGDLGAFMASCRRMQSWDAQLFLPGHGAPVLDPKARIDKLLAHRTARNNQILAALGSTPVDLYTLAATVYADLAPHLMPAAARNLFAHLVNLVANNQAQALPYLAQTALFKRT